jgi:hypothetical protein
MASFWATISQDADRLWLCAARTLPARFNEFGKVPGGFVNSSGEAVIAGRATGGVEQCATSSVLLVASIPGHRTAAGLRPAR